MLDNSCKNKKTVRFSSPEVSLFIEITRPKISEIDKPLFFYSRREIRQFRRQSLFGYVRFAKPLVTHTVTIDRVPERELCRFYYTSKELKDMVHDFLESPLRLELGIEEESVRESTPIDCSGKCVDVRSDDEVIRNIATIPRISPIYPQAEYAE